MIGDWTLDHEPIFYRWTTDPPWHLIFMAFLSCFLKAVLFVCFRYSTNYDRTRWQLLERDRRIWLFITIVSWLKTSWTTTNHHRQESTDHQQGHRSIITKILWNTIKAHLARTAAGRTNCIVIKKQSRKWISLPLSLQPLRTFSCISGNQLLDRGLYICIMVSTSKGDY